MNTKDRKSTDKISPLENIFTIEYQLMLFLRYWKLIILITIIGGVFAFVLTKFIIKPMYKTKATIYAWTANSTVKPTGLSSQDIYISGQLVNDYQELLKSRRVSDKVFDRVMNKFSLTDKDVPKYTINADYARNTRIVTIECVSEYPELAMFVTNETANVFASLIEEILLLDNVKIIDQAILPKKAFSPRMFYNLPIGVILGFLIGVSVSIVLNFFDRTIKTPEQAKNLLLKPIIGTIDLLEGSNNESNIKNKQRIHRLLLDTNDYKIGEDFRLLRTNLHYLVPKRKNEATTIMFTSSASGEGKSSCCASTGLVAAQAGKKVLLFDADLRRSSLSSIFKLDRSLGLTSILVDDANFSDVVHRDIKHKNLDILTTGPLPPNPSEMLLSKHFTDLLKQLKTEYDYILIDVPPCLMLADPLIVGHNVDAVLFVIACNEASIDSIKHASEQLAQADIDISGIVINKFNHNKVGYGYGYSYRYKYGYSRYSAYFKALPKNNEIKEETPEDKTKR